jgi:sigma-B regulation protein RsbU (phosphoserine phosphatase)
MRAPESLGAVLTDFNRVVYSSSTPDRYSTLFCGLFDGMTRRLAYVICGHLPPMVLRAATNKVERLNGGGFPIGLLPIARYEQSSVELQPGDLMVCFSDGISEAANPNGEMWDESEVARVLMESGGLSARETVDRLFTAADAFAAGAEQSDDMTVLAVRMCD